MLDAAPGASPQALVLAATGAFPKIKTDVLPREVSALQQLLAGCPPDNGLTKAEVKALGGGAIANDHQNSAISLCGMRWVPVLRLTRWVR